MTSLKHTHALTAKSHSFCAKLPQNLVFLWLSLDEAHRARHVNPMLIYKIFRADEWRALEAEGETLGAPIDLTDGYVHFSTAAQAAETAAKYFAGVEGLMLLAVDSEKCEPLKWEPSRGGDLFPHLYRALSLGDILWAKPLPCKGEGHIFPLEMQ